MPDLHKFFFRPTQNFHEFAPALFVLCLVLLVVFIVWVAFLIASNRQSKNSAWKRFRVLARRYLLNRQEFSVLRNLAISANMSVPSRLLTSRDHFERAARVVERHGKRFEKKWIRSLRKKIYGESLHPAEAMLSTDKIPPGTRLLIQYLNDPDTLFWGHLVDNDRQGLIVIVPSNREIRTPLRMNTHLEITAYVPESDPVIFVTWVKSVIPGPRKMVVLGHSEFVVSGKELYSETRLVGPQFYSEKPTKPARDKNNLHHNSSSLSRMAHV